MKPEITTDSSYYQMRIRLQSEKTSPLAGSESVSEYQDNMRTLGVAVGNLLKYTGFLYRARRNCVDYRLERNDIYLPDLPAAFNGYTILHLSDLHADGLVDEGEGIRGIVEQVPCDLAVFTGDFSYEDAAVYSAPSLEELVPIINSISAQDGMFGILGNHDSIEMMPVLERMGIRILLNDAVQLQRGTDRIILAGVDDPHFYKCHDLQKALSAVKPEQYVILLSHSPEIADEASDLGVDIYLCGHTHGGQICLPGRIPLFTNTRCNRSYLSGSWNCGAMQGYTSRGTGYSLTAARLFCPPEITLHTLHSCSFLDKVYDSVEDGGMVGRWFETAGHAVFA